MTENYDRLNNIEQVVGCDSKDIYCKVEDVDPVIAIPFEIELFEKASLTTTRKIELYKKQLPCNVVVGSEINNSVQDIEHPQNKIFTKVQATTESTRSGKKGEVDDINIGDYGSVASQPLVETRDEPSLNKSSYNQTQAKKVHLTRATIDSLNQQGYDWNIDYFQYKEVGSKEASFSRQEYLAYIDKQFIKFNIDDSTWDDNIVKYGLAWEQVVKEDLPKGIVELFRPLIFGRLSGDKAKTLKNLENLKVPELVQMMKSEVTVKNHPLTIVGEAMEVLTSDTEAITDQQIKVLKNFVDFITGKSRDEAIGLLVNVATKEEFRLNFDFFKGNKKTFRHFVQEYRNHGINLKVVKKKVGGNIARVGRFSKSQRKLSSGSNSQPKFPYVIDFYRKQFNNERLENSVFNKIRMRNKRNLCTACGKSRNHDWKTCDKSDLW